jgi:hypothetical protein
MAAITPQPGTKRIYLQQPCDYKSVAARPDLKFQMYHAIDPPGTRTLHVNGYGFVRARGAEAVSFPYERTEQRFENCRLPLLTQRVSEDGVQFEQTSFTTSDAAGRPLLMVRLRVKRQSDTAARELQLGWLTVRAPHARFYSHSNEDYIVFEPWGAAWGQGLELTLTGNAQRCGDALCTVFRHSANVTAAPGKLAGARLMFRVSFREAREGCIEMAVPYEGLTDAAAEEQLRALSFDGEYRRQAALWRGRLERAAAIDVPEKLVEDIYQVLTCNNLQFLGSGAGAAYLKPGQGGYNSFSTVYGWESSNYLPVMDQQGFDAEVGRVLDYYLTTQHGHKGPEGDISTAEGTFRPHIHWMCETGAIVGIFADHALLSGDFRRLRSDAPALLKAANWIRGERARTRDLLPDGSRTTHYGLMPPGRATDWPDFGYSLFTDAYTWRGLDKLARAFETAGFSEAGWLRREADDYRQCILAAVERIVRRAKKQEKSRQEEKPVQFVQSALLEAGLIGAGDGLAREMEAELRRTGAMDDLFATRMPEMEDAALLRIQEKTAGGEIDLYYVNSAEKVWQRLWLEQGERAKALRYFYMTLAYSTSRDVHIASERFSPQLPWLLPWQPNASGNGRILEMILNTLWMDAGDTAKLLYGAPDAWFRAGVALGVRKLRTPGGVFSFSVRPAAGSGQEYEFGYECSRRAPGKFLVALPDGRGKLARRIVEVETGGRKKGSCRLNAGTGAVVWG